MHVLFNVVKISQENVCSAPLMPFKCSKNRLLGALIAATCLFLGLATSAFAKKPMLVLGQTKIPVHDVSYFTDESIQEITDAYGALNDFAVQLHYTSIEQALESPVFANEVNNYFAELRWAMDVAHRYYSSPSIVNQTNIDRIHATLKLVHLARHWQKLSVRVRIFEQVYLPEGRPGHISKPRRLLLRVIGDGPQLRLYDTLKPLGDFFDAHVLPALATPETYEVITKLSSGERIAGTYAFNDFSFDRRLIRTIEQFQFLLRNPAFCSGFLEN